MQPNRNLLLFCLLAGTVGCDQGTKSLAVSALRDRPPVEFLHGVGHLLYAQNTGAFGSLGAAWPEWLKLAAFVVLPLAFLGALLASVLRARAATVWRVAGVALIVGGGVGNLIDRVVSGYVVDFVLLGLGPLHTNVFNVADVALLAGIGLALFDSRARPAASQQG